MRIKNTLNVGEKSYDYYSLEAISESLGEDLSTLPFSLKVLLENLIRHEDGQSVTTDDIKAIFSREKSREIAYRPARVLMQDFTGVPAVVDLAAMRDAVKDLGGNPEKINPLSPVDLVIDHSVMVDHFGTSDSFRQNVTKEMERNLERYEFLKWGQSAFDNFRVVPPGTGICHQVNLEYLAKVVWTKEEDGKTLAYPDTLVGTDSHTTMINGLGVLGWGVGGIEAEAAMLGQPISMLIPEVVGFKLIGKLQEGVTATDLVLTVVEMLRKKGVVGKFVEFYGAGLDNLSLADRATIANMAPEYGATCGFFPVDEETIKYLKLSGRDQETIDLIQEYSKAQGLWRTETDPVFTSKLTLNLDNVDASIAGPNQPKDRIPLKQAKRAFQKLSQDKITNFPVNNKNFDLHNGDVVIAAITSCTNTSNPSVMIAAGLVAKKALAKGLTIKPWVKTSLAPGSQVVTEYLEACDLQKDLDNLGFNLVGYGCTTCIGNSGPLDPDIESCVRKNDLVVTSVLSGNRNFDGRISPLTKGNYLMSPPLVVAYAIAGTMAVDITTEPLGKNVYLKDIWPTNQEISEYLEKVTSSMFKDKYSNIFAGTEEWQKITTSTSLTFPWNPTSSYTRNPPYFDGMTKELPEKNSIDGAKILALLGDSITTDHISPAGVIAIDSPAAAYLQKNNVSPKDFNSYGSRRGNHEVMMRGTFANVRIKNEMAKGAEGGLTAYNGEIMSIYDAAIKHKENNTPLVVIAGKEYGTGSSRDWAAKGTTLLGIKAVIAESFERIHRSNLVGMGVLPLTFNNGDTRLTLDLDGTEMLSFDITTLSPLSDVLCTITYKNNPMKVISLRCRIDTADEMEYYNNAGILHKVIRDLV